MSTDLVAVPPSKDLSASGSEKLPALVRDAGKAAHFAYQEFFYGKLRNPHTRVAYERAVRRFLAWCQDKGLELQQISPAAVGRYLDEHPA